MLSNKRKFELEKEWEENKKRYKNVQEEQLAIQERLDRLDNEQVDLKWNRRKITTQLKYQGFKWLVPPLYSDFTPLEKQYNKWCKSICLNFKQNWVVLRTEIRRFYNLHFTYGWTRVLMDLLNHILSRDVIGLIVGYAQEEPLLFELRQFFAIGSWEEARQAMYWLWYPHFIRPAKRICMDRGFRRANRGLGYVECIFSYDIYYKCQVHYPFPCEAHQVGQGESKRIVVTWKSSDPRFQNDWDFHKSEFRGLLQDSQSRLGKKRDSWVDLMERARLFGIQDQVLPALFLVGFEKQIHWLDQMKTGRLFVKTME